MKTVGYRSIVLYLLLVLFVGGLGFFGVRLLLQGDRWAMQPYNGHLYAEDSPVEMGAIRDREGDLLAGTVEGQRRYSDSETVRRALLHTVGDPDSNISTSVEYAMRAKLTGYNPVTGLNDTLLSRLGRDVSLTVEDSLCAAAYTALEGHRGAVLVYDYKTGEILCKVSAPTFDPADPPEDIEDDPAYRGVYLDNNLSCTFTPGSIFKLVTAAAAMEQWPDTWSERTYSCDGSLEIGGDLVTCLHGEAHGEQDLAQALGNSCNVYFGQLARDLGAAALEKKAAEMGFGKALFLEDMEIANLPVDLSSANENQLAWAGVGQYTVEANPFHMLCLMGAIANGGEFVQPRLTRDAPLFGTLATEDRRLLPATQAANLKALLRQTVSDYYGDWLFPSGWNVCAKTGTGEVGDGKNPNCWMVGFCDDPTHPYAFAVLVEEGAGGMESAGSAASAVLKALENQEG